MAGWLNTIVGLCSFLHPKIGKLAVNLRQKNATFAENPRSRLWQ